jgi:hypothetical protein
MSSRNNYAHLVLICCALALIAVIAACGPSTSQPPAPTEAATAESDSPAALTELTATPPSAGAYPAPVTTDAAEPYPGADSGLPVEEAPPGAYPPPSIEETFQEPRFRIDLPLSANATLVSGQAPPNLALAVLDVTYNGEVLGIGRSDENGRFEIPVSPLIDGNRIGITVGELQPGQSINDMAEQYYPHRGEGFMNLPNIGVLFDTTQVQP